MFFLYLQNNSGGGFDRTDDLDAMVFVEALTPEEADKKAQTLGIYFDGVRKGLDCECCGDRWDCAGEGEDQPLIWGDAVQADPAGTAIVHYADSRKIRVRAVDLA